MSGATRSAAAALLASALVSAVLLLPRGSYAAAGAGALLAALGALGSGSLLVRLLPSDLPSPFLGCLLSAVLGWGILGTALGLLGFGGYLTPWPTALVLGGGAAFAPSALAHSWRSRQGPGPRFWPATAWGALALALPLFLLVVAAALRPPTTGPALSRSAALAVQWALSGEAWARPGLRASFGPCLPVVWRAAGHVLGGRPLGSLLGLHEAGLCVLGAALAARGILRKGWVASLLAGTTLASLPIVSLAATERSAALAASAFGLAALWALLHAADGERAGVWSAVSGLLAGFTLSCGWQAWPLAAACALAGFLVRPRGEGGAGAAVARLGGGGLVCALPLLPWLARSAMLTGDPLYPYLTGGPSWDPVSRAAAATEAHLLMARADWFSDGAHGMLVLGPLALLLLPLAAAAPLLGERGIAVSAAAGVLLAGWSLGSPTPAWLLPGAALLSVLAAASLVRLRRRWTVAGRVLLAGVLLTVAWQVGVLWRTLDGDRLGLFPDPWQLLGERVPGVLYLRQASRAAPSGAVLLLVGETRAYVLDRAAVWGSLSDPAPVTLLLRAASQARGGSEDLAFRAQIRRRGITHVLVSPSGAREVARPPWDQFREYSDGRWADIFRFLQEPRQVWGDREGNALWEVRPADDPLEEVPR